MKYSQVSNIPLNVVFVNVLNEKNYIKILMELILFVGKLSRCSYRRDSTKQHIQTSHVYGS